MEGQKLFITGNGYEFLGSYLTELYGERGSAKHNLLRYINSEEYKCGCHYADTLEQIPELQPDQIKAIVKRQERFRLIAKDIQLKYDKLQKENKLTLDDYFELAGIMGLAPGRTDRIDTLFPHLLDLYVTSQEEGLEIEKRIRSKPNVVQLMVEKMMDSIRDGHIFEYNGHHICSQGYARYYYRGENAYNHTTRASLFRCLPSDPVEAEIHNIIGELKIIEFSIWLMQLQCVCQWPYGDVFHGAIAQHYGIYTNGLDVSSDLKVALFFACCTIDKVAGQWRPLKEEEYEERGSRVNVLKRGGDSMYGILFSAPADICELSHAAQIPGLRPTNVTPIGFQPFQRCPAQHGYMIETGKTYDMYKDQTFAKVKFRHSKELCQWVYREMDEGRKIYPPEKNMSCEAVAHRIQDSKQYSEEALRLTLMLLKIDQSRTSEIEQKLINRGYLKAKQIEWCSPEMLKQLDEAWCNMDYCSDMNVNPVFKFGFCI